jgi:hypothetical protein
MLQTNRLSQEIEEAVRRDVVTIFREKEWLARARAVAKAIRGRVRRLLQEAPDEACSAPLRRRGKPHRRRGVEDGDG